MNKFKTRTGYLITLFFLVPVILMVMGHGFNPDMFAAVAWGESNQTHPPGNLFPQNGPLPPNVSADKVTNTWYKTLSITFTNEAGWGEGMIDHYHYLWNKNSSGTAGPTDPTWSSSDDPFSPAISSDGSWYLHVLSHDSTHTSGGTASYGPYKFDGTDPIGSIQINYGDIATSVKEVTLTLTSYDGDSGVDQVRFRNDDETWGGWQYASFTDGSPWTKPWTLRDSLGVRTVFYEVQDNAGNSLVWSDTIVYRGAPPTVDSGSISDDPITLDDSTVYTLTIQGSKSGGASYIDEMMAGIFKDTRWDDARGYFGWGKSQYTWTGDSCADQGACDGGGYVCKYGMGYGHEHVTVLGCTTSTVGNTRTVNFQFSAEKYWGTLQDYDLAGRVYDEFEQASNWEDVLVNFDVLPAAPIGFTGVASSTTAVEWSWTDDSGNVETGFHLQDDSQVNLGTTAADVTVFVEGGLSPNLAVNRHVHAFNDAGDGPASGSDEVYTLIETPDTPTVEAVGPTTVTISTKGVSNISAGNSGVFFDCDISHCETGINSWTKDLTAKITGLAPETTYNFRVKARNGDGVEASWSGYVEVVTTAYPQEFPIYLPLVMASDSNGGGGQGSVVQAYADDVPINIRQIVRWAVLLAFFPIGMLLKFTDIPSV